MKFSFLVQFHQSLSWWEKLKKEVTPNRKMLPVKLIIFLYVSGTFINYIYQYSLRNYIVSKIL